MIDPIGTVGIKAYETAKGTAGTDGATFKKWIGYEDISGGDATNATETYAPAETGVDIHVSGKRSYSNLTVSIAEDASKEAYGDSLVTMLTDHFEKRDHFDLIRMKPRGNGNYKVEVFDVSVVRHNPSNAAAGIQKDTFELSVSGKKEFTGTIENDLPVLVARAKQNT